MRAQPGKARRRWLFRERITDDDRAVITRLAGDEVRTLGALAQASVSGPGSAFRDCVRLDELRDSGPRYPHVAAHLHVGDALLEDAADDESFIDVQQPCCLRLGQQSV